MKLRSRTPDDTTRAAAALADAIDAQGAVVVLSGPLGAGKTLFVKGLAAGLGVPPEQVTSPTFVVAQELALPDGRTLVHVDCYRIERAAELEDAGLLDWLAPGALVAVEWGERWPDAWPADRLELRLARDPADPDARALEARATGSASRALLERWSARLGVAD